MSGSDGAAEAGQSTRPGRHPRTHTRSTTLPSVVLIAPTDGSSGQYRNQPDSPSIPPSSRKPSASGVRRNVRP